MYVMLIFALALLSPLPFVSPFASVMQDATAQSQFSSFDVDPTSSTVQPLAGPAFALVSEIFETEPVYRYNHTAGFLTMSISEYEGTVYALATNPGEYFTRINITNPYDIRGIHTENIHDLYGNPSLFLRDNTVLSFEELPYIILTLRDSSSVSDVGGFRVLNYPFGFEVPTYGALSEANDGAEYENLAGAGAIDLVTLGEYTYALVASFDDGVQIINVTEPDSISAVLGIFDGTGNFTTLAGAFDIATTTIGSSTYALVASISDNGVQIIDITDINNPIAASAAIDGQDNFVALKGARDIAITTIGSSTYALVVAQADDGVQIIDITDPYHPTHVSAVFDGIDGYDELDGADDIAITTFNNVIFAVVVSDADDGIQFINITDPYNPLPMHSIAHGDVGYSLGGPRDIAIRIVDGIPYVFVLTPDPLSPDTAMQVIKMDFAAPITLESDNANPKYAKAGDTLTLNIFTNSNITSDDASTLILNLEPNDVTFDDSNYYATRIVSGFEREEYAIFSTTLRDDNGDTLSLSNNDVDDQHNVFVDTQAPRITLVGSADHKVPFGASAIYIPGAVAIDKDPKYSGNIITMTSATLDTSVLGSAVLYTYTTTDSAGNTNSTTRTVTVSDMSQQPEVSSLKITSDSNINYARPGNTVTLTLELDGFNPTSATGVLFDTAVTPTINGNTVTVTAQVPAQQEDGDVEFYITVENSTSTIHVSNYDITDGSYVIIDATAPLLSLIGQDGAIVPRGSDFEYLGAVATDASYDLDIIVNSTGTIDTDNIGTQTLTYTASDVLGNTASSITRDIHVQDISAPETVKAFRAHSVTHGVELGEGYGIVDVFERHDRTYAMFAKYVGSESVIVDITGANITFANLDLNIDEILDIATINIGESSFALITSLSDGGSVHILNMDDPYNPLPAPFIKDSSEYPVLGHPNSITATTIGSSTYALVTSTVEDGVQIINITDPYNPTAAWHITDEDGAFTTLNHPTSIITTTIGSSTYALVTARDDHGVQIIDITNPYEPIARSAAINNSDGFTALSNVEDIAITTIGSKTYALAISNVGDRESGVQIIDITAPANPTAVSVAIHDEEYPYLIHPESIDTITVDSRTYALVTSTAAQLNSGVQIIDITTPSSPFSALSILDNDRGYENVRNGLDIEAVTLGSSTFVLVASDTSSASFLIPDTSFEIISLDLSDAYIFSKNSATKYAKAGDTLISRFAIDDTVVFTGGSILGYLADAGIAAGDYRAKIIVPDVPIEGYATFIAEVANADKHTLFVTEDDIPSNENVFVDTIRPNIELLGPENYIVPYRASYLHVPGAVATDGDLDYSGLVVTRTNDTLDSDVLDSVVLYTYTATDPAGNTNSTTRTVTVSDITQPEVSSFGISSSNGSKYAGVGHTVTLTLNLDGFNPISAKGVLFGENAIISINNNRITASAVVSQDSPNDKVVFYLIVENSTSSLYLSDYDITDNSYVLVDTIGPKLSLLGGATVTVAQGYNFNDVGAIATDLSFDSDVIVYSTDSVNTLNAGTNTISYTAPTDALGNIGDTITRTVYVVTGSALQLKTAFDDTPAGVLKSGIDITGPTHTTTFKIGAATYAGISSTDGLAIVDITDIANPSQVSLFNPPASANISSDVTFTAFTAINGFSIDDPNNINETIYVPNTRFAVSLHDADIVFVNISDVNSPSYHSNITDRGPSELDGSAQIIIGADDSSSSTPLAIVAASDDDGIEFFHINFLTYPGLLRPSHLSSFTDGNSSLNGDIFSLGGASSVATTNIGGKMYVLVAAYDDDSVQILDITPPVGSPTTPHIASTITDGVDGFDRLDGPNFVTTVTIDSSHYALVTSSSNIGSVQIIDITDPYNPIAASSFAHNVYPFDSTTLGSPSSIVAIHMGSSTYALISASQGVQVVDITDPYNPIKASSIIDGDGGYTALLNTANIHTTTIDSSIYGLVTSESDSAVQLVRFDPPPIAESNNPNPGYATAGDRLSFVFSVNDPIESSMIQFITPDQTPTVSETGVVYDTRLTVPSDPVEGYAKFVATLENNGGVNLFVTEDDFSESIFVDTIGPRIELVGSSFHGVLEGSGNPIIPGAIVTDGDPGYTPTYTVSIDGNLDPNVLGSSAIYTYTATSDTVGNPGDSINRTVEVITYNPIPLTSLAVSSDNTINNNYARAGDTITITLEINSIDITSIFGIIAGSEEFNTSINGNDATLTKILKQSDENGELEFELQARNSSGYTAIITNEHLTGAPIIIDTIPPTLVLNGENNTSFPSGTPYVDTHATAYDLSYGFQTISFSAGSIHTTTAGNFFLRYTAPNDPAGNQGPTITRIVYIVNSPALSLLDGNAISPAGTLGSAITPTNPRHVDTFKIGTSTYAGVGGSTGLFIVDITDTESPEFVSRINGTGGNLNGVPFTTFVEIGDSTYALSAVSDFAESNAKKEYHGRVMITDVSIPDSPVEIITISNGTTDGYTKMRHPTSIATVTIGSSTYALVTSGSTDSSDKVAFLPSPESAIKTRDDGVQIIDITNPSSPTPVSSITDGVDGYTELRGAASITTTTIGSSTYALVASSDDSAVQIIDITDPTDPIAVSAVGSSSGYALGGASYITTTTIGSSTYALVAARTSDAIQIIDITNPSNPVSASAPTDGGTYSKLTDASSIAVVTGQLTYALVTSPYNLNFPGVDPIQSGIQVIDITTPYSPTPVSTIIDGAGGYTTLRSAESITTTTIDSSTYALVAARDDNGVQIMSITPSTSFNNTNPNPEYAKAGDTLTFRFTTNNAIASDTPQFIIPPKNPSVTIDDTSYDAVLTIPSDPVEDYAKFTITLTDNQGVGLFVTEDIFPASIFVDTIGPRIDLIGSAFHSVLADTTNPIIPGAIVTDGDPEYSPSYTVTTTGNLDTSNVGSTVTYTYTAQSDIVGNPGASVNRTVTVIDYDPISVTNLAVSSNNALNDSYAKAGDTITISFTADSSDITSVSGILLGNNEFDASINGNQIVVSKTITQDDVNGDLEFEIRAKNSTTGYAVARHDDLSGTPIIIDTVSPTITLNGENNTAFAKNHPYTDAGATAYDLSYGSQIVSPSGTVTIGTIGDYPLTYTAPSDLAGNTGQTITRLVLIRDLPPLSIVDDIATSPAGTLGSTITPINPRHVDTFKIGTSTYAGVGGTNGLFIVDITDTESPEFVSRINGTGGNLNNVPFTTFVEIDDSTYAVSVASDFASSNGKLEYHGRVMITDVSTPDSPVEIKTLSNGTNYPKMRHPTSIATVTVGSSTYALVTSASSIISASISIPTAESAIITRDDSIQIIDITNPRNPTPVSTITDGVDGYTELRGAASITTTTIGSSTYALVASLDDSGIQIIDITDPTDPIAVSAATDNQNNFTRLAGAISIATTTIDSSHYAIVVASSPSDRAVQIINITNPNTLVATSSFSSDNIIDGKTVAVITGLSTYAFVTSTYTDGVQIIDITTPGSPTSVSHIRDGVGGYTELDGAYTIATTTIGSSTYALVAALNDNGVQIIRLQTPLTLDSTNPNSGYATTGDTLTVGFTVDDTIASYSAQFQIPAQTPSSEITYDESYLAMLTVPSTPVEDNATFSITALNSRGAGVIVSDSDYPKNVFIDTIGPRIALVDVANYEVYRGTQNLSIPGAIATDGDPGYSPNYTVSIDGTLDTDTVGSSVIYTYTADADTVGNPGDSVTRTVTVIDYNPLNITSFTASGDNSANSSYAKAGDTITITLDHYGIIDDVTGNILGDDSFTINKYSGATGLTKVITQSDTNGNLTFDILLINSTGYAARVTQENLTSVPIIIDTLPPTLTLNGNNNSISALGKPYTELNATAYDLSYGSKNIAPTVAGTVNIFSIANHTVSYSAPSDLAGNAGPTITRNVGIQVLPPLSFTGVFGLSPAGTIENDTSFTAIGSVSTFQIGTATYAGTAAPAGLSIINITDIESPNLVSIVFNASLSHSNRPGVTHIDFVLIDGSTYALSAYYDSMLITNVDNPASPYYVAHVTDGADGFTALSNTVFISTTTIDSSTYALVAASNDNGVQIIDITDPSNPEAVSEVRDGVDGFTELSGPKSIATTTIDSSTYALVASSSDSGVQIINITTPSDPTPASAISDGQGNFTTLNNAQSIATTTIDSSTYALVASFNDNGVQIIDITDPYDPIAVSSVKDGSGSFDELSGTISIAITTIGSSTYALVASYSDDGVQVIDITNPHQSTATSSITDGAGGYTELKGVNYIIATTIDSSPYAITTAGTDKGVQFINLEYPLTIKSNNANPAYAKAGNTLTLGFAINDSVVSHAANFVNLNKAPTGTVNDQSSRSIYSATLNVPSDPIESFVEFIVTVANDQNVGLSITEDDLRSNVFVDTIAPTIELIGDSDHTVYVESQSPFIPGAIATDGDPGYSQNYTITIDGTLDTNVLGSTVTYTYTADDDTAGNPGHSVNRTVTVIGYSPITITSLTISGNNQKDSSYVKAGNIVTITLVAEGTNVGNATGNIFGDENLVSSINGNRITFTKTVTESDINGAASFEIFVTNSSGYAGKVTRAGLTSGSIIVDTIPPTITLNGENNTVSVLNYPYTDANATAYDNSYGTQNILPIGFVTTGTVGNYTLYYNAPSDSAGNTAPTITRNVIVLELPPLSITDVFDVSSAGSFKFTTADIASYHVDTFQIDTATYAGLSSDSGLFIINITDINSPSLVSTVFNGSLSGDASSFVVAHTTFVSIDGSTYAISAHSSGVLITNVNNPASPSFVAYVTDGQDGFTTLNSVQFIATTTIGSSTYALVASYFDHGVQIIDITNPYAPTPVSAVTDGQDNFTTLSFAFSIATTTIGSSTYALVAASGDHGVQIINITTPSSPTPASAVTDGSNYTELSGAQHITTTTIGSSTYALVASPVDNGVQIINITNPYKPTPASSITDGQGNFKTLNAAQSIATTTIGSSTYALVAAKDDNGVQIIDITNPYNPTPASSITDGSDGFTELENVRSIATTTIGSSTYALTASSGDTGIEIINLNYPLTFESNNTNPAYAKEGDMLTLDFKVNDTIVSNTTQFTNPDRTPSVTVNDTKYTATLTVPSDPIESFADFVITLENNQTVTLSVTENDFPSVFIDTIAPTIELEGDADHTVYVGTQNPIIPGAIATDNSPGYSTSDYDTVVTGSFNTSIIGSTVTYTYTAHTDAAGNPGASMTRTVTVIDYDPLPITSLTVKSDNSANSTSYAKAGDTITINFQHYGFLESATGNILGDETITVGKYFGATDLKKVITQSDTNGNLTFDILVTNSSGYAARITQDDLPGGNIIIDTISPTITLNGVNDTVSVLNRAYADANATAYDLSYGSKNISPLGFVVTSSVGNNTLYYNAPADFAGNTASTITRNVIVLELPPLSLVDNSTVSPTFSSNNLNTAYAKAGDTLTLEFTVNDTIVSNTTQFTNPDQIPSVSITDDTYTATLTVPTTLIESYADFVITVENSQTVGLTVTENDFSPNVFIDTIAPTIELVGDSVHTVYVGTQNPIIPGAIATDGSSGYSTSNYSTSITGTLDTSIIGSTVTYTYTADADAAGNPGASTTRTVAVVDYDPLDITTLTVKSDNSVNSTNYAKAGDEITINLQHYGIIDDATGTILGDDNFTVGTFFGATDLKKVITQSDTNGDLTFDIFVINSSEYASRVTQNDLTGSNIIIDTVPPLLYLYGVNNTVSTVGSPYVDPGAISYDLSYGIQNVTGTGTVNSDTIGTYTISYDAPDFAGNPANITRTVHVQQLAPISLTNETSQFLVSPTTTVDDSADYPYLEDSYKVTTVKIDDTTYALVGSYDDDGFTILDITTPESPTLVFNATENTRINADLNGPTGISTIQIENSIYAVITSLAKSRMAILDITNPALPVVKSITNNTYNPNIHSPAAVSTVDIDGSAYALVVSKANSRIAIFNITNPMNLTQVAVLQDGADYTLGGVTHVTPITMDDSTYILTAARSDNSIGIIDIGNPQMPKQVVLLEDGGNLALSGVNSIDTISINDRTYALVASPNDNALQIIDVTHPTLPFPVSTVIKDTEYPALSSPHDVTAIKVENSTYALLSAITDDSIQIIDITNPESPQPASHISQGTEYTHLDRPQTLKSVQIDGAAYALIASRDSDGIQIIKLEHEKTIQSEFSITVNGASSLYANVGDTVSIQITVNDTIDSSKSTVQILNLSTNVGTSGSNTITASVTIPSDGIEMYTNITASITSHLGAILDLTENDIVGQNVFVDTISPRITVTGNADHTVLVNTVYNDQGATAIDGNPEYSTSDYSTSITGTLDTSIIGSTVNYTYTADDDAAGNPGASINRTVTVIDYNPLPITSLTVSSDNSVNSTSYAKVGDVITINLQHYGVLESATGIILGDDNFTAGTFFGATDLKKVITQSDTNGNLTFDILVTNSSGYAASITQNDLASNIIIDTVYPVIYLYGVNNTVSTVGSPYVDPGAISYDLSYGIQNVTGTGTVNSDTIGTYTISYDAPDFAGNPATITRTVHVQQLAPISLTNETSQFLVSPTTTVTDSADYPHLGDSYKVTTVKIDDTTYALVGSYDDDGFTILDITTPESPTLVFNATENTRINADLNGPTGISTIQIENSIYAVITSLAKSRMAILDITNPALPVVKSITTNTDNANIHAPFAISTVDIDGTAYALVVSKENSRIAIFNITNPTSLTQVAVLQDGADYTLGGVTHVTPITMDDSTYILTAARSDNSIGIIDIGNPQMSKQVALLEDGANLALSGVNSIDTISINDRTYALVASPGDNAMQIIDVTHPTLPFPVSSVTNGTEYPVLVKPHDVTAIKVENSTYALLSAINDNSIQIIDITNPESPQPASHISQGTEYTHLEKPQTLKAVQIDGAAYALIAARNSDGIQIIKLEHEQTTQSSFSITVNGANSLYAKAGDTVSIQITVNDTIDQSKSTVQILNLNTNVGKNGPNTINASVTIPADGIEMYTNVTASISNHLGAILNLTENDIVGQNVFVDTIPPRITVTGNTDHTVLVNTAYNDQGASASDGSPGYSASYSTSIDGTLDPSIIGSTVNYTYTADDDAAGNPGASINRTVTVVDYVPLNVTILTVKSDNSVNSSYAKAGDEINITLVTDGSDVGNVTGDILGDNSFAQSSSGGTIIFSKTITQSDPNGNLAFDISVTNSSGYATSVTQNDLTGSNIIIDTISPIITLNGNNETTIEFASTYEDLGATVTDASYENPQIIYSSDVVDTSTIGTYTLVYTTLADPAGNPGSSIKRIVTVSDSTPAMLNSLIINTSNTNPAYAKAGDLITVTLVANQTISSVDASIQNMATNNMIQGNTLYANYTVQNGQEGNTTFEITVYFDSSTPLTVTESNLNSNIYIDTEKPQLTLVGHFNITIPIDQSYTDTIANVADNDPSYNGNVSSNASRVDTSNADTYTIVYSADADAAGNIPDDITRTVTVSGFVLSIFSNNANYDTLAKKGNLVTIQLVSDQYIDSSITSATMLGRSADATSITGSTIYVNTTIQDSDINGNIEFSITLNLSSNLPVTITHDDLTSANVTVDTNPPVIVSSTTITPNLVSVAFDESIITYPDTHFLIGITPLASSTSVKNGSSIPYSVLEIELNPSPPLSSNATPTITFGRAAITDLAGNGLAETSTTASDGIAPSLQDVIIVSPTIIEIIFDEKIRLGNGFTRITPSPTVNGASSSPGSTISGNALIITSTAGLFPIGVAVNITVATHGIADEAGNAFEPSSIFKDYTNAFAPYTISETMILVPYDTDLDPNTISSDDYRVSFGSGAPSTIIAAELSNDPDTVMITMQIPFGTGDTPFIEQPGTISDTLGNAVTLQSTTTRDGTAPIFISVVSASTSGLITIFGEGLSSLSFNIGNYDSIGPEVRSTDSGISDGTVIMVTSTFIDGGIRVSSPVVIEDSAGNKAKEGSLQNIVQDQ